MNVTLMVAEGKVVKVHSEGLGLHFLVTCRGDAVSSVTATGGVYLYTAAMHVSSTAGKSGN